jgi:hypothetical protein
MAKKAPKIKKCPRTKNKLKKFIKFKTPKFQKIKGGSKELNSNKKDTINRFIKVSVYIFIIILKKYFFIFYLNRILQKLH